MLQRNCMVAFLANIVQAFPDHVDGGTSRFDQNGVIYQAICGNCVPYGETKPDFPVTPGVWGPFNASEGCNLVMVKIAFNLAGVGGRFAGFHRRRAKRYFGLYTAYCRFYRYSG